MQTILQMTLSITFQYGCAELLQNSTQNAFTRKTDPPRCSKARFGSFLPLARREGSQGPVTGGQSTLLAVVDLGQDLAGARRGKTKHSKMQISDGPFSPESAVAVPLQTLWSQLSSRMITSSSGCVVPRHLCTVYLSLMLGD